MIREALTEEDCGLNSSWSIRCSFPISLFPSLISNWWNGILGNMPRRSFSILIAVWNFTFPAPLGHRGHRHTIFFSKFSCSYSFTHLCSIPFILATYLMLIQLALYPNFLLCRVSFHQLSLSRITLSSTFAL